MEYTIRSYVDELFKDVPDSQRAYEMRVELIQNLLAVFSPMVSRFVFLILRSMVRCRCSIS